VTLTLAEMPAPVNNQRYICEFGSDAASSTATYDANANTLTCPAAVPEHSLFAGRGITKVKVKVKLGYIIVRSKA